MTQKMMDGINIIVILFLMNILWFIGVLVGLVLGGLVSSTAALIHVMQLPKLFSEGYSYKQLVTTFLKEYVRILKKYRLRVLIPPMILWVLYVDILIVQQNNLMKALFQWPIILFMGYIILIMINYLILENGHKEERFIKKIKFSAAIPLIFPLQAAFCFLLFSSFIIISFMYSWFAFISMPVFLYTVSHLFVLTYKRKGMVTS